jgi:hypothetical protein
MPDLEPLLLDQRVAGQTGLSKFDTCPRDYYLYRKHPGKQSHPMARGICWHGGIDRLTAYMIENGEPKVSGEVARDFVEGYISDHPEYVLTTAEYDAACLMAWNWGEATVLDLENILGHEIGVTLELGGWLLRCRIDLVYGYPDHIAVHDYKTSLAMPREEEVQRNFQGKFYSLAVLEGKPDGSPVPLGAGLNDVDFSLVFPRYRDKEYGNLKSRGAAFDRKDLVDFKSNLLTKLRQLERFYETQEWPAVDGNHCGTCTAQALCPIAPELRDMPEITTVAQAEDLASTWYAMDRQKARLQKGLREWVSENGPVYFGDLALDITPTESQSVESWPQLEHGIQRAVQFGEEFDLTKYRKTKHGTKFAKRKQTEDELDGTE